MGALTYCQPSDVDQVAEPEGLTEWTSLEHEEKLRICSFATRFIEAEHAQPRSRNRPFGHGANRLREIAVEESLYLSRTLETLELAEISAAASATDRIDSAVGLRGDSAKKIGDVPAIMLRQWMQDHGITTGRKIIRDW